MGITLTFALNFFLFGIECYEKDELFEYNELNIYFSFIELKFQWT